MEAYIEGEMSTYSNSPGIHLTAAETVNVDLSYCLMPSLG